MKKTFLISLGFFLALGLFLPAQSNAQILPGCDQTLYIVAKGGWVRLTQEVEEMPEGTYGPAQPVVYQHITTPDRYNAHPEFYDDSANPENIGSFLVTTNRSCGFNDFVQLFVNIINWGFSILTIVSLFFFIWGGFSLLISGGRSDYIEAGKKTIEGTFIGIIVVLTAYIIVNFYVTGLIGDSTASFLGNDVPNPLATVSCAEIFTKNNAQAGATGPCGNGPGLFFGCTDGAKDGAIHQLQSILNKKCNNICGEVNGCYGNQTAHCVRMFQLAQNLPITGVVDIDTWNRITDTTLTNCSFQKYLNPLVYPEYENVFPTRALEQGEFGSCRPVSGFSNCLPAHGPEECPKDVPFFSTTGPSLVNYEYFPTACL